MPNKPHLLFRNPVEGTDTYRPARRGGEQQEEPDREPDYTRMGENFGEYLRSFNEDRLHRVANRTLAVPAHIEYIDIEFFGIFNTDGRTSINYEVRYYQNYGLSPVKFYNFNRKVLFSIIDDEKFNNLLTQLQLFVDTEDHSDYQYDGEIRFIKSFSFLSSSRILNVNSDDAIRRIKLIENDELFNTGTQDALISALKDYLDNNGIPYHHEIYSNVIESDQISDSQLNEIADNFDIIQSINSFTAGIIRPSAFGLPIREYGFTISDPGENLPIVGVVDSGVSDQTPLANLLIRDTEFNITGTAQFQDNVDHGTAVAGIVALGTKPYPDFRGEYNPDARILPIKVLDSSSAGLPFSNILSLIRSAHEKYGIKIFTLTIGFMKNLTENQEFSDYAYALDKLSYELDVLVLITTSNNRVDPNTTQYDSTVFTAPSSCISSPAESLNNITVGACAENLEEEGFSGLAPIKTYPTQYTRRFHVNQESIFSKRNKNFIKPDLIYYGGDYSLVNHSTLGLTVDNEGNAGLKVISSNSNNGIFFKKEAGTSFATPFVANLAAKLVKIYPQLNMQTVKALIINSCNAPKLDTLHFPGFTSLNFKSLIGHGIPDETKCLASNDNEVTFILEDSITMGEIKIYPLRIPDYLNKHTISQGLLEFNATLTFRFDPIKDNQLLYCPYHLAFMILRNRQLVNINNQNLTDIKLSSNSSWSQDAYNKKLVLANTQKIRLTVSREKIITENNVFKIAINSHFHKYMNNRPSQNLINFSLIIRIGEKVNPKKLSNRLYDEIRLVNNLEVIGETDLEAEL